MLTSSETESKYTPKRWKYFCVIMMLVYSIMGTVENVTLASMKEKGEAFLSHANNMKHMDLNTQLKKSTELVLAVGNSFYLCNTIAILAFLVFQCTCARACCIPLKLCLILQAIIVLLIFAANLIEVQGILKIGLNELNSKHAMVQVLEPLKPLYVDLCFNLSMISQLAF